MILKTCKRCGVQFTGGNRAEYCADCRPIARFEQRKQWEQKTDYAAKDRERKQATRERDRQKRIEKAQAFEAARVNNNQKLYDEHMKAEQRKIEERAKNGDAWANAWLAMQNNDPELFWYWRFINVLRHNNAIIKGTAEPLEEELEFVRFNDLNEPGGGRWFSLFSTLSLTGRNYGDIYGTDAPTK